MDIKESLSFRAEQIEKRITRFLENGDADIKELSEAIEYSLTSGGKRVRPYLTLEFCKLICGDTERAMPYAFAVEMIHTYSLVHDDLPYMDDDLMRR